MTSFLFISAFDLFLFSKQPFLKTEHCRKPHCIMCVRLCQSTFVIKDHIKTPSKQKHWMLLGLLLGVNCGRNFAKLK